MQKRNAVDYEQREGGMIGDVFGSTSASLFHRGDERAGRERREEQVMSAVVSFNSLAVTHQ